MWLSYLGDWRLCQHLNHVWILNAIDISGKLLLFNIVSSLVNIPATCMHVDFNATCYKFCKHDICICNKILSMFLREEKNLSSIMSSFKFWSNFYFFYLYLKKINISLQNYLSKTAVSITMLHILFHTVCTCM